jgi:hypothetical protein
VHLLPDTEPDTEEFVFDADADADAGPASVGDPAARPRGSPSSSQSSKFEEDGRLKRKYMVEPEYPDKPRSVGSKSSGGQEAQNYSRFHDVRDMAWCGVVWRGV